MQTVGKQFPLPETNPGMLLKVLLDLNLHKFLNEVDEITEKANKEAKHEDTLKSLENTWATVSCFLINNCYSAVLILFG